MPIGRSDPVIAATIRSGTATALGHSTRTTNLAIAALLYVTERTVEAHVTQILQKLRLPEPPDRHRRVLAVLTFLRAGPGSRAGVPQTAR